MLRAYRWRVAPAPTGRYRAFETRGWPSAEYQDERPCAEIISTTREEYRPAAVRDGNHAPLRVVVYDYSRPSGNCPWTRCFIKGEFATVNDCKFALSYILAKCPQLAPEVFRASVATKR